MTEQGRRLDGLTDEMRELRTDLPVQVVAGVLVGFERSAYVTDLRALQVEVAELKADVATLKARLGRVAPGRRQQEYTRAANESHGHGRRDGHEVGYYPRKKEPGADENRMDELLGCYAAFCTSIVLEALVDVSTVDARSWIRPVKPRAGSVR